MSENMNSEALPEITESIVILNLAIGFMDGCSRDKKFKKLDRDTFEKLKMMLSGATNRLERVADRGRDEVTLRDDIAARLEELLDFAWPKWVGRAATAYPAPVSEKDLGSFTVSLGGTNKMPRGCWFDFEAQIGGGADTLLFFHVHGKTPATYGERAEAEKLCRDFLEWRSSVKDNLEGGDA